MDSSLKVNRLYISSPRFTDPETFPGFRVRAVSEMKSKLLYGIWFVLELPRVDLHRNLLLHFWALNPLILSGNFGIRGIGISAILEGSISGICQQLRHETFRSHCCCCFGTSMFRFACLLEAIPSCGHCRVRKLHTRIFHGIAALPLHFPLNLHISVVVRAWYGFWNFPRLTIFLQRILVFSHGNHMSYVCHMCISGFVCSASSHTRQL